MQSFTTEVPLVSAVGATCISHTVGFTVTEVHTFVDGRGKCTGAKVVL
jgi:hypothetical protein